VPIATGNQSDSLHALVGGAMVQLRVPYPMGFFAKGLDGRIDDPKVGWKGRGLWVTSGNRTPCTSKASTRRTRARPAPLRKRSRARWWCSSRFARMRSRIRWPKPAA
jgi:hypothetical protein